MIQPLPAVIGNEFHRQRYEVKAQQLQSGQRFPDANATQEDVRILLMFTHPLLTDPSSGNLSVRSLADVVSADNFIQGSEYLETLLVAVPR